MAACVVGFALVMYVLAATSGRSSATLQEPPAPRPGRRRSRRPQPAATPGRLPRQRPHWSDPPLNTMTTATEFEGSVRRPAARTLTCAAQRDQRGDRGMFRPLGTPDGHAGGDEPRCYGWHADGAGGETGIGQAEQATPRTRSRTAPRRSPSQPDRTLTAARLTRLASLDRA